MILDLPQVVQCPRLQLLWNVKAFQLCSLQGVGHVDGVEGDRVAAAPPEGKPPSPFCSPANCFHVPLDGCLQLVRRGQPLGRKGGQHVAQGGDGQNPRGQLLRALERVGDQVEHGVGQGVQGGGRGADLQAAKLGIDVLR